MYSLAKATSDLPVTQPQVDELDLVSVIRSLDSSINESAITHQPRIPPSDIGVCRDKSVRLPGLSDSFRGILLVARDHKLMQEQPSSGLSLIVVSATTLLMFCAGIGMFIS